MGTLSIRTRLIGSFIFFVLVAGSFSTLGLAEKFYTDGIKIKDDQGREVILRGTQLINKRADYLPWHREPQFDRLLSWGFNVIRLGVLWSEIEPQPYVYNDAYLAEIDRYIQWAKARGILVVVDMHQDLFSEKFNGDGAPEWATLDEGVPYQYREPWWVNYFHTAVLNAFKNFWRNTGGVQDHFIRAWVRVAERYADESAVIGFDLYNEPWNGYFPPVVFDLLYLQPFYERLIPAMQVVAPDKLYFFEPAAVTNTGAPSFMTRMRFTNLVAAPHYYNPAAELRRGYEDLDILLTRAAFATRDMEARIWQTPWWLGEFGTETGFRNHLKYMDDVCRQVESSQVGSSYWEYARDIDGMGLELPNGEEKPLVNVLARTYPQRIAGRLRSYRFDLESKVFQMTFEESSEVAGPTIIFLPQARHYPEGFSISSTDADGSWVWELMDGSNVLQLWADPNSRFHTITIRPAQP